ncbi:RNA polymerase sigma factor [Mycobacterium sp. ITM-2016-00317]|uniref:RNA polymerase sigma factor n=1 Tax=Mycobacterium sp. ITM-2016-00317 TaxID=2099694 RepID=UPI00287FD715|nr:RNA polymerase sigma factor [Mycobacterium sp. ITM-2016-00317]WNG90338.1 RNA polymerase sigma factor [Mycobacterium sp. ITM-2016-00317]
MHEFLFKAARRELYRRSGTFTGKEVNDLALQVAADALLAVLAKLPSFRGESQLTTWAYRFAALELSNKLKCRRRHSWTLRAPMDHDDWDNFPDRVHHSPSRHAEAREMLTAVTQAVTTVLTERQRDVFIETVVEGNPPNDVADKYGISRNTLYKSIFDSRRKIRRFLAANGFDADGPALTDSR